MAELKWTLIPEEYQRCWEWFVRRNSGIHPGVMLLTKRGGRILLGGHDHGTEFPRIDSDIVAYSEPIDYRSVPGPAATKEPSDG